MAGNRTSFRPGQSGNPKGWPKGAKDVASTVRAIVNEVPEGNVDGIRAALARVAISPRTALAFQDLRAKVNGEFVQAKAQIDTPAGTVHVKLLWGDGE